MAGSANTSECCPSYQLRQYHSLSAITNELKALHVRIIVAAKVGVPQHVLPRRPRKLEGHHQHRAAQVAHAIGKYRPQLRAQATSAAVGASTPLHAYRPALANSATWCPPRTSDGEIRDREASSCSSKSENVSGAGESRDAKLPEGLSTDVDMGWVSMVTVTMPRFYRLYRAVPKIPPEKRQGNAANGGLYSSMDHGRDSNGARSSEYSEDLCRVLIDIRRHLAQNPAGDIAQRLLESCPYARCETTASRPFTLQTIYTGVADNDLAGVPGRAAVLIGLHGALAMVEGIGEDPCSPENSPKENDRSSRSSSCSGMVQCHSEREAHLRSAMVLADALLQHRGAGTLTLPEMRCFVTIITQMQPSVMLHLTGAAATSRAVATTSLELLLALARTLAAWPMFGTAEFEKKHWELSRVLLLQHQAGIKAAMVEAEDLHTQRPLRFIDLYVRGFYTSITSNEVPSLDPKSARPSSGPSLGCTATSGDGSRGCPGGGRLEGTRGDPHWIAEHMMKLFLRRCGSPGGGRGLPLRLSSAMHEEERTELTRMLLAAAMDGCRHSLVAVGGSTMKTVLTSIAALGCFRENSAKMVAAFIDTAAMAALAMDKARDGIRQGPLADNASSEPSAAFSLQIYEAAANGLKRATSCSSGSSNGSGSSRSSSTWRSGSINNSNGSSAGGIPYADGPSPSGVLGEGLLGLRLMTSAQLVVQHCPEAALFARKSETTMETGAPHNGDQPVGPSDCKQQLDPFWLPKGVPSVAAVTLLPLPAALSHHISLASTPQNNRIISARVRGDTKEQHRSDVSGLAQWLRRYHALSMMALTDGGVERMVLLAAQVSLELLREGIDVVMVPELYQLPEQIHLRDIQDFINLSIIDHPHHGMWGRSRDSGLHPSSTATATTNAGSCAIAQAAAGSSSAHGNLHGDLLQKPEQCVRLYPNWQSQRRLALNGVMSTLLDLRGSSVDYVKFIDVHGRSEQPMGTECESTEAAAQKGPALVWNELRDAVEKRRSWLSGNSRPVWLKLTLMAFEVGHGGELGKPLPLQVDSPFRHFRDWRDNLVGADANAC